MFSNIRQRYQILTIIQRSLNCIFEWSKMPIKRLLAYFWSLVSWTDLILHIVTLLNVFQHQATLPGHERLFNDHKNAFLNQPKSQKRVFGHFLEFDVLIKFNKIVELSSSTGLTGFTGWKGWTGLTVTDVEHVRLGRYSSQRQLRSGLVLLGSWSVGM